MGSGSGGGPSFERPDELINRTIAYGELVQILPIASLLIDARGTLLSMNQAACKLLRRATDYLEEMDIQVLFQDKTSGEPPAGGRWFAEGNSERLLKAQMGNGELADILVWSVRLPGNGAGFLWLLRDASVMSDPERALRRKTEELETASKDLEHFVYGASHDLKEPLRVIDGHLKLLELEAGDSFNEYARQSMKFALDGVQRALALINGLLAYSRTGFREEPHKPVDAEACLREALTNLEVRIKETEAVISSDPMSMVFADPIQLTMLFQNFVSNALKFTGSRKPRVHISYEEHGSESHFRVADNGIGIEAKYLDRIFKMFERLHSTSEFEGTGIGLALCKRIVELHGGRIWVESEPGAGSEFHFTLSKPADRARSGGDRGNIKASDADRDDKSDEASPLTTILVDDVAGLRALVRIALERGGAFRIVGQAATGQEGIDLATELQPDVVLLDLSMPGMDGLEALPLILEASPQSKVVIYSGFEDSRLGATARELGALGYIEKGAEPEELRLTLLAMVAGQPDREMA